MGPPSAMRFRLEIDKLLSERKDGASMAAEPVGEKFVKSEDLPHFSWPPPSPPGVRIRSTEGLRVEVKVVVAYSSTVPIIDGILGGASSSRGAD